MELKIHFKNVGQGDTIIIEWIDSANMQVAKFGMIDCNLVNGDIVSVIDHIKKNRITQFEFVIMSHPHSDHFSGFLKFFDYCESSNIVIKQFIHTSSALPLYYKEVLAPKNATNKDLFKQFGIVVKGRNQIVLYNIFARLREQYRVKKFIKDVKTATSGSIIDLSDRVKLKFLSPHEYDEITKFIASAFIVDAPSDVIKEKSKKNNPLANYLSTLIQIYDERDDWQILLSSDCTIYSLKRIKGLPNILDVLKAKRLLAFQVPHHGSSDNHIEDFWNEIPSLNEAHSIISVGLGYGHPSLATVKYFEKESRKLHSTGFVGGYREFHLSNSNGIENNFFLPNVMLPGINFYEFANDANNSLPKCGDKCFWLISGVNGLKDYGVS